ncbi:MAG TPA: DUF4954 family protein [Planctomycetota bacterium]|nr:DUF4954 family protein [Planctomycetota bacterium]
MSRSLSPDEIRILEAHGSRSKDWSRVRVADGFSPECVARSTFSGEVFLGAFRQTLPIGGVPIPSGVYDSHIHNSNVGDESLVQRVGLLSNYDVGAGACVFECGQVCVEGESAFGNGVKIETLNESGGRELTIYSRLSAQAAYLAVCYRHRPKLIDALEKLIGAFVQKEKSNRGSIGEGARVMNCGTIRHVRIGDAAIVDGAARLENGTIVSKSEAQTTIGAGVVASDFIIHTGSVVDGRAIVSRCFIGQACKLGRQFSAENSAFFANCEGMHGEAVSVLAGPYTVTHHKSSLLIAGLFSFYNAGSGTNQSNHMYKLGPLHQGVLERGCKTGSFSYLLWPARVGAFTAVIGKHYSNFDTRNMPFSYIVESDGKSLLSPAVNLFTVGTKRDGDKWPARDRRKDSDKLDRIHFPVFSPLTVGRMMKGLEEIKKLYESASRELEFVNYNGIAMKRLLCKTAIKHYEIGIKAYLGGILAEQLESGTLVALNVVESGGDWVDVLGLLAPRSAIESLCDRIESGTITDLNMLECEFVALHKLYYIECEWNWANEACAKVFGKKATDMSWAELGKVISEWRDAVVKLDNMILTDAEKEFGVTTRIGFGIDGDDAVRDADFAAVRGTFESNKFVKELKAHTEKTKERAERILKGLH